MNAGLKLYEIRDNHMFIGTWTAKNAEAAIQRAKDELNLGANSFRRSWTRVELTNPTATEIKRAR